MIHRYRVHSFLTFEILDRRSKPLASLLNVERRYSAFRETRPRNGPPDLRINIGPFRPQLSDCLVLDDEYCVGPDYLFHAGESGKLGGFWRFECHGINSDRCTVNIDANWTGIPFVPGRIIDFFIQYMLAKRGYLLIHAAGIAHNQRAVLLSGRGGGGKTTLTLRAMEQGGYGFLGDNFTILRDGIAYGYPSDLHLFGYNMRPVIWGRLKARERSRFRLFFLLYRLSAGYIKIFTTITPYRIFPDGIQESARTAIFFSLLSGSRFSCEGIPRQTVVKRTLSNQKLEFFPFLRRTSEYGCIFPDSFFARYWSHFEQLLADQLPERDRFFQVTMPVHLDDNVVDHVLGLARSKLGHQSKEAS
jgi:hypothetical protein